MNRPRLEVADILRRCGEDYRDGNRQKTMTVSAEEFIRRFLLHVLPKTPPRFAVAPSAIRDHQYPFSQYVSAPGLIRFVSSSCAVGLGYFAGASGEYTFGGGANA